MSTRNLHRRLDRLEDQTESTEPSPARLAEMLAEIDRLVEQRAAGVSGADRPLAHPDMSPRRRAVLERLDELITIRARVRAIATRSLPQ
jgi:hypothetical protein